MTDPTANSSPEPQKRSANPRNAYNPVTLKDLEQKEEPFFKNLNSPFARRWAAILSALIFFLGRRMYLMAPLQVVVLLACVLYRMNSRKRLIAAVPLTFAAIRLGTQLGEEFTLNRVSSYPALLHAQAAGVTWLPLFLAACLFYTPWKISRTGRAIFWQALLYLMAGLLPLEGFFVLSTALTVCMFFVISATLILDISKDPLADYLPAARPLAPLPAHS